MDTGRTENEESGRLRKALGTLRALEYLWESRADDVGNYRGYAGPIWRTNIICVSDEAGEVLRSELRECGVEARVREDSAFGGRLVVMSVVLEYWEIAQIRKESLEEGGVA
jgi:hypothetical protein